MASEASKAFVISLLSLMFAVGGSLLLEANPHVGVSLPLCGAVKVSSAGCVLEYTILSCRDGQSLRVHQKVL